MLFMKDNKVVYYIDALTPGIFQYLTLPDGRVMLKHSGSTDVIVDADILPQNTSLWICHIPFTEAYYSDNPYIKFSYDSPQGYFMFDILK